MKLNDAGHMVNFWYHKLEKKFPNIQCGDFVCMPNHIHCIINNSTADINIPARTQENRKYIGTPLQKVLQWFKSMTTNAYIHGVQKQGWPVFHHRVWQRNYYEHIIRNEADLICIQKYIQDNPLLWEEDTLHPKY